MLDYSSIINNIVGKFTQLIARREVIKMARPIEPTPVLRGREAERFERKIKEDLNKPTKLIPTPKLEKARELVIAHAIKRKERF